MTLTALGCAMLTLLPHPADNTSTKLRSLQDLASAYVRIVPGTTRASQLAALGFDTTTANVHVLSYLGVIERFASDSRRFDHLDDALQSCIDARDRCTAMVFKPGEQHGRGTGVLSSLGLGAANAADRVAEVTLLVLDGRVAYKAISGVPQNLFAPREAHATAPSRPLQAAIAVTDRSVY